MPRKTTMALAGLVLGWMATGCGNDPTHQREDLTPRADGPGTSPTAAPLTGLQVLRSAYADVTGESDIDWAAEVALSYSGAPGITLHGAQADDPDAWWGCPRGESEHAARRCPLSPLDTIETAVADGTGIVREEQVPMTVGCDRPERPDAPDDQVISVRPDERHRDCFSDFAVTMYLDASGAVLAVDFVLSSP